MVPAAGLRRRLRAAREVGELRSRVAQVEGYLAQASKSRPDGPVVFFNASTRIDLLSLNAGFNLLASWAVRAAGGSALQLICRRGLEQCMLGTRPDAPATPPPCAPCLRLSDALYASQPSTSLRLESLASQAVQRELDLLGVPELSAWERDGVPFGQLCVSTVRWALRRHHLADDPPTRGLLRSYIVSAVQVAAQVGGLIENHRPRAFVLFNGITYPEATARHTALARGIPVITHEVGMRPNSAFFSHGQATAYPIELPGGFRLSPEEDARLDHYLEERFAGRFTMAGIRFWREIQPLPEQLLARMRGFRQTVVVFSNVIFDTSQIHANTHYTDMFRWLEDVLEIARQTPDTLFILRAHPDEDRPGKASRQSVSDWVSASGAERVANVVFIPPNQYVNSYDLIRKSKATLVYNSSIGLEASILGASVLCAGQARYTQLPTVTFPESREAYLETLAAWLQAQTLEPPESQKRAARQFLYYQLFRTAMDFSEFLEPFAGLAGFVRLRRFAPERLRTAPVMQAVQRGILEEAPFVLPADQVSEFARLDG